MIATNDKQSKKLIELGIPTSTADMWGYLDSQFPTVGSYEGVVAQFIGDAAIKGRSITEDDLNLVPVWSLSALLNILPENVGGTSLNIIHRDGEWVVYYYHFFRGRNANIIEACVKLIEEMQKYKILTPKNETPPLK